MKRGFRTALAIGAALAPLACFALLRLLGPSGGGVIAPCPLYRFTGLYCPGCGSYRALHALSRLRLWDAFCYNPLVTLLVPAAYYALLRALLAFVKGVRFSLPERLLWGVLLALFAFGLLRNLPFFPFTLLAPGAMLSR